MSSNAERLGQRAEPRLSPFTAAAFTGWLAVTASWWALAFAPLPVAAEWLSRTRAVCFGTLANGLPDTWGWMLLVLGPLSIFAFFAAVWGRELLALGRWLARRPDGLLLLCLLGLALAASGVWLERRIAFARSLGTSALAVDTRPFPVDAARGFDPAPALALIDQNGGRLDLAGLRGRPVLVSFAFAHCVAICPRLAGTLRRSLDGLPVAGGTELLVVTLDPWRDTPRSLPGMLGAWGLDRFPRAHALSGTVAEVESVRVAWGVEAARDGLTGEITHAPWVFVVDRQGRLAYRFLDPPASWLVEAVTRLDA
jgi:cytochrome oxidase Cu insertion factor (SCO1/SenC/PrrC family)